MPSLCKNQNESPKYTKIKNYMYTSKTYENQRDFIQQWISDYQLQYHNNKELAIYDKKHPEEFAKFDSYAVGFSTKKQHREFIKSQMLKIEMQSSIILTNDEIDNFIKNPLAAPEEFADKKKQEINTPEKVWKMINQLDLDNYKRDYCDDINIQKQIVKHFHCKDYEDFLFKNGNTRLIKHHYKNKKNDKKFKFKNYEGEMEYFDTKEEMNEAIKNISSQMDC
tara:strand:- start:9346 stop:10014 length:669 start_codon:yes stop_codon:yes gene_type:complete